MANTHRRMNHIGDIKIDGVHKSSDTEVGEGIVNFFRKLYQGGRGGWRPRLDDLAFDIISETEASWLESPFSEQEVAAALD